MSERQYAMTRVKAGDYLLPSNDALTLWRIYQYEEEGTLEYDDGTKLVGTFWACARRPMPHEGTPMIDVVEWSEDWQHWAGPFKSRKEALEDALRSTAVPV